MKEDQSFSQFAHGQLEALVASAVDAILTISKSGIVLGANPATKRLFGYDISEIVGQNIKILMPSPYHEEHDDYLAAYLATGDKKIIGIGREVVGKRKDGTTFPMHLAVSESKLDGEAIFTGIVRDISDLKEREAQLQGILDNAVDAIITIDERGIVLEANPSTQSMFGYEASEILGQNVKMLMPSPYFDEHDGYLANYLQSGNKKIIGIGREVVGKRKDGSTFPMHLAVSEVSVGDRRMFTGIVRDISDLKEAQRRLSILNEDLEDRVKRRTKELRVAQAELVKAEKMATLGQVSGGIAHEIRNPLNAVKTSAFFLLNAKAPSQEKTKEHLERIDRQVTIIDNVVTALSDVARLPDAHLIPHRLESILERALKDVSIPSNIVIELNVANDVQDVLVDENQIPMVFKNLIRNARDAMPDGGDLRVFAKRRTDHVIVEVTDTGVGISPDQIARVTEPLYSTKARGMGLGLAISLAILEKNDASMEIDSELGKGSTFRVNLKAAR
jgi:two-component system sensor kinase FixL